LIELKKKQNYHDDMHRKNACWMEKNYDAQCLPNSMLKVKIKKKKRSKSTLANILNLHHELWGQENPINSK
jgi:hypothetical protein